jgi:RND superfamily putative drug exporter
MIRVARWAARRPRTALAVWLAVTAVLVPFGMQLPNHQAPTSVVIPNTPNQRADETQRARFGPVVQVPVLLEGARSELPGQITRATRALERRLRARVTVPTVPGARAGSGRALLLVSVRSTNSFGGPAGERVRDVTQEAISSSMRESTTGFSAIGKAIANESVDAAHRAEMIAIPILLLVLLIVFRSPVAAGIPALLGIATVGSAFGLVDLVARVRDVTDVAGPLTSMLGLALGVDYALLMVSRFREGLAAGMDVEQAVAHAVGRAGRTVIVAGATLLVTMAATMALSPGDFLLSAAIGVSAAGVMGVFGALVGVPAMLILVGTNVDRWRIGAPPRPGSRWAQFARTVQRHPIRAALPALLILGALVPSALTLRTGPPDVQVLPVGDPARQATERVTDTLGPGWAAPYTLITTPTQGSSSTIPVATRQARALRNDQGVATVLGPLAGRDGASALVVVPRSAPNDPATPALGDRLRTLTAPGATVQVGGIAASLDTYQGVLSGRLIWLVAALSAVAFVGLVLVLRAMVLALISVLLNLLTIAASLGTVALLCTGTDPPLGGSGSADILALLGMFAIVFALSLDYQIFILTRMRENWDRTHDLPETITHSIDSTGRVITGAAAIMAGVFFAFTLSDLQTIRQPGVGLVTAVLIDATLIRLVLLPATMKLAGPATFWIPAWLDRRLPSIDLEGTHANLRQVPAPLPASPAS